MLPRELEMWLNLLRVHGDAPGSLARHFEARCPGRMPSDLDAESLRRVLSTAPAARPAKRDAIRSARRWLDGGPHRRLLPITDPGYPALLREIPDPPPALFVEGRLSDLNIPCLAVVGARNATPQGRETARSMARSLADTGFTVVSGLALGIDGCAHRGALEAGATIAVCAHGPDRVYPAAHQDLAGDIAKRGARVTEFMPAIPPRRHHFPMRNRIISGMSLGTLVVEAGLQSGSLITARLAAEQNREVFAVPGSIDAPQSKGCHELIRSGVTLVTCPDDMLRELGHFLEAPRPGEPEPTGNAQTPHGWFLDHMGYAPCTRDELVNRSGLTSAEVSSMLLTLELEGCVELCPGGTYVRVNRS